MDRDTDNSWAICLEYHCPLLQQKGTTFRTVLDWASQSQETKCTTYQLWVSYIATTIWTWEQKDAKRLTDFHSGLSVLEQKVNTKTQFIRKGQWIVYGVTWHPIIRCKKRETEFPNVWVGQTAQGSSTSKRQLGQSSWKRKLWEDLTRLQEWEKNSTGWMLQSGKFAPQSPHKQTISPSTAIVPDISQQSTLQCFLYIMHVERAQCEFLPAICSSSKHTTPPPVKIGRSRVPSQIRNPPTQHCPHIP